MYLNQTWPQTITYHNVIISLPYFVTYSASYQRPGFSLSYSLSRFLSQKYSFLFHFLPSDAHTTHLPSNPSPSPPCWDVTKRANCPHRQTPSNALRWNCAAWFALIHSPTNIYVAHFSLLLQHWTFFKCLSLELEWHLCRDLTQQSNTMFDVVDNFNSRPHLLLYSFLGTTFGWSSQFTLLTKVVFVSALWFQSITVPQLCRRSALLNRRSQGGSQYQTSALLQALPWSLIIMWLFVCLFV